MTKKVQKILLIIFLTALIVSLMAASFLYASTYGRYSGGTLSDDSTYDDTIEFIGTERYIVRTPEELNDAIENGYSYIQIADDAEQPFVITTDVQDVSTNLVLDLNGTVVVRNSRNPMLNVSQGVSVVLVYDSSEERAGAFYNPVGSALQVSGGTMTIGSGNYESGPRTNEYADATAAGTLSPQTDDIVLFSRGGVTSPATVDRVNGTTFSPVTIAENTSYVPVTTGNYYYQSEADSGYSFLTEDTFLIYTLEEGEIAGEDSSFGKGTLLVDDRKLTVPCNVASCDFYYYYATGDKAEDGTDIYAVVYGYWDVKELAEQGSSLESAGLQWPYAAIRMTAGEGFVRGGNFVNQFDVANTYGILTEENSKDGATGSLVISETGRAGTTNFTARGEAVCIGCWEGDVAISGGNFSSELGNTIVMSGGTLNITAGNFNKNAAAGAKDGNGAAISMQDGALTIAHDTIPVQFTITGSYVNGIEAQGGTITAQNASFLFNGTSAGNNTGVASEGGQVKLTSCTFTMPGDNNRGIASQVTVASRDGEDTSVTNCTFTLEGSNNRGVYVSGGSTSISGSTLTVGRTGTNKRNFGIEAAGGRVDAENATINVYGTSSAGIYTSGTNPQLNITGSFACTVTQDEANTCYSAAIMATSGSVTFETDNGTINTNGVGVVVRGGTLTQNRGSLTVNNRVENMYGGTGIYIANGNFTQAAGKLEVNSTIRSTTWADFITGTEGVANSNQTQTTNGIYITGGSLTANGTLNVAHTGVENDTTQIENNNSVAAFTEFEITSFAIRVQGAASTRVAINAGSITNAIGGGVNVSGGDVFLGNQTGNTVSISTKGTGDTGWIHWYGGADNWGNEISVTGGHAVDVQDGTLTIYNGTYSAAKGEGVLVRNGTVTIEDGTFSGQDGELHAGPAASYALKMYGGTANISGGTFGGSGSGAFITGTAANAVATAKITGGTFEVDGQGGFSVFEYANVTFDPAEGKTISVSGEAAGLILEGVGLQANGTTVTIRGGTFESTATSGGTSEFGNALWNGNRLATLEISGGSFDGLYAAFSIPYGVQAGGSVTISGGTFENSERGISLEGALNATHAAVISGGTFTGGSYGAYYGVNGENANDGLLIEGGTFTGTGTGSYGFYFNDNPWSTGPCNNVAIIGGTFSGKTRSIGTSNEHDDIAIGDVLTEHVGNNIRYGVAYDSNGDVMTVGDWWDPFYIDGSEGAGTTASGSINLMPDEVTLTTEP